MSKYEETQTVMDDVDHLVGALKDLGYTPEVHDQPVHLVDYCGKQRPQVAHVIIRRAQVGSASNDVGYYFNGKAFQEIVSEYDGSTHWNAAKTGRLMQFYTERRTMAVAKQKGYQFNGKTIVDGKVRLQFAVR